MRSNMMRFVVAIMVCVMMTVAAFAEKKGKITFSRDITVNGTLVKKGTYKVMVDESTNEMSFWNGKDQVAKVKVTTEQRANKNNKNYVTFTAKDNTNRLNSIALEGDNSTFTVADGSENATPQQ